MKRLIYSVLVLVLLIASTVARAEEAHGGTEVTAALNVWVNQW